MECRRPEGVPQECCLASSARQSGKTHCDLIVITCICFDTHVLQMRQLQDGSKRIPPISDSLEASPHVPNLTLYPHQLCKIVATFLHHFDTKATSVPRPRHMQTCLQNSHKIATKNRQMSTLMLAAGRPATSVSRLNTAHGVAIRSRHHAAFSSRAAVFE